MCTIWNWIATCLIAGAAWAELPEQLPDLQLWLRADRGVQVDAQGHVTRWEDQSGAANHLIATEPDWQPTLVEQAVAGHPAVRFDGVDDALTLSAAPIPVAGRSVFAVVRWDTVRTYSFAIGCAEGTDGYLRMHNATSLLTGGRYPLLYQNGLAYPKVGRAPTDESKPFHMGLHSLLHWNVYAITESAEAKERIKHLGMNQLNNTPQNRFKGEIAEILIFDAVLSAADRVRVEQYLGARYLHWPALGVVPVLPEPGVAPPRQPAHGLTARPLEPGRYRVHFTLDAAAAKGDSFSVRFGNEVQTLTPAEAGEPMATHSLNFVIPVQQPPAPQMVRVTWEAPASAKAAGASIDDLFALDDPAERSQDALFGLWVQPLSPIVITSLAVDKILYAPHDAASASVTLRNYAADTKPLQVRFLEVTGLNDRRLLGVLSLDLAPDTEESLTIAYHVGDIEYGRELLIEALEGEAILATHGEPYSVADNLWKVAIGSTSGGAIASTAPYTRETIANQLRNARANYSNWYEKTFWAPDDWGQLTTPPGATWYSGQARRHENTEKIQFQVETAHQLGMKAITYGKCMAGGYPGWDMARTRPQWFVVDDFGRTRGRPADVWDLDHWEQGDTYAYADFKYIWTYRWVDLRRLDALDHGIDQLIASTRQFGWDGVRFDSGGFRAHFVPKDGKVHYDGVDSFNARNTRRMKERIWEVLPDYLFGYNTNDPVSQAATKAVSALTPDDPAGHEFREMMAGGGLWMFEGMRDKPNFWGRRPYTTWSDYATDMVQAIRTIRHYGGHVCFSYGDTEQYKYTIGTMIGAHDYVGEHGRAKGSAHWGRFLTRWSSLVWDHRLRPLPTPTESVQVTTDRPLWWQEFANELVISPTRRLVIVHLLNPPLHDECAKTTDEMPPPVTGIHLQLAHADERLVNAMFIAPGYPNRAEPLAGNQAAAGVTRFALPRLDVWGMVVVELEGNYTLPTTPPPLTEPLSPAELAEMEQTQHTGNVAIADNLLDPTPQHDPDKVAVRDFGAATVTPPNDFAIAGTGRNVLLIQGFYHATYGLVEALQAAGATVATCTARDLPADYPDLRPYDVIVLINMGAELWDANGHQRLADYTRAGGRLVVLGGPFTLGQGFFKGTALEAVLPVEVRIARDVYQLPTPLTLGPAKGVAFPDSPLLYFYHAVTPRPDSTVRLWAGDLPIAHEHRIGKGTAVVFTGTTMGEATDGALPFWTWPGWPPILANLVLPTTP